MATTYPHKYEVVLERYNVKTRRPLVDIVVYKGNDLKEAQAVLEQRARSNGSGVRVRLYERTLYPWLQ